MLTVLGIVATMGAVWFGFGVTMLKFKGATAWAVTGVISAYILGSLGCLVLAFLCFGGKF